MTTAIETHTSKSVHHSNLSSFRLVPFGEDMGTHNLLEASSIKNFK
jgi:hypothetical protein